MRVALQTWGSDGDIRPMIALAAGLVRRGHSAVLSIGSVDNKDYTGMCSAVGVECVRAPEVSPTDVTDWLPRLGQTKNPFKMIRFLHEQALFPSFAEMSRAAHAMAEGADLAVGHFLCIPLRIAAGKRALPHATVSFWPGLIADPARPPDGLPNLGRAINSLLWSGGFKLIDRAVFAGYRAHYAEQGAPLPRSVLDACYSLRLNLIAASAALWPHASDLGVHRFCGALSMPAEAEPEPLPPELQEFLAAGPPPVFLTLGSMAQLDPASEQLLIDAAERSGERAIVQRDTRRPPLRASDSRLAFVGRTSHAALLPRCAAVLHHGGAGTSHTTLSAGRPAVVLGFMEEQLSWGRTLVRNRVASASFRFGGPDANKLGAALGKAARDPSLREKAVELGARLRAEDGVAEACRQLEELVELASRSQR